MSSTGSTPKTVYLEPPWPYTVSPARQTNPSERVRAAPASLRVNRVQNDHAQLLIPED